jgi:hypothetical protein
MAEISNDLSPISGSPATPAQQADEALVGTPAPVSKDETAKEAADATLVDLSSSGSSTSSVGSQLASDVPPDVVAAGALVSDLASQISGSGSEASSAYSLLSADATLKLTQP